MSIARRSVHSVSIDSDPKERILDSAQQLFARRGYAGTTTRDLAQSAGMAEGTLFRHFDNKKSILIEVVTRGWVDVLTDLLTALSEMSSYKAVGQVLQNRMLHFHENADMLRVCFMEAQFHPELSHRIQTDIIDKMTDVAEAFFQTAMERGEYRKMDPRMVAKVFLGMFTVAGFSQGSILNNRASVAEMKSMAEGMADIFLNGVLVQPEIK
ncbi:MAG: TetR/AcrR family transcriptional regulator [Symploca sp. SIO2B6]|nr:TetR/AcrR family transcriptional regulator [Symploca sp. SIO2B6]